MTNLTDDRLRLIANPVYVPCCTYDEEAAMATELLAARQRLAVLERVREAAEDTLAVVSNGRIRPDWVCELSEKLTMMRAALDAAKEAK